MATAARGYEANCLFFASTVVVVVVENEEQPKVIRTIRLGIFASRNRAEGGSVFVTFIVIGECILARIAAFYDSIEERSLTEMAV